MARVVSRRQLARPRVDPRGLGGIVACLSPLGWLSAAAAAAWVVIGLEPLTSLGVLGQAAPTDIARSVVSTVGDAALVALPAGLELGFPRVRRVNPWLWRGFVLLAVATVASPLVRSAQGWISETLDPGMEQAFDPSTALGLAFVLLSLAPVLLTIGALWAASDGLGDAGARPRRPVLQVVVAAGLAITLLAYAPLLGPALDMTKAIGWANLASLLLSLLETALWFAVGVRLVSGGVQGLLPRAGWMLGLLAGLLVLVLHAGVPVLVAIGTDSAGLPPVLPIINSALGVLLLAAALAGLGRGTRRRTIRAPLMRLFVVRPTA